MRLSSILYVSILAFAALAMTGERADAEAGKSEKSTVCHNMKCCEGCPKCTVSGDNGQACEVFLKKGNTKSNDYIFKKQPIQ
jgi:hypothetical protein